MGQLTRSEMEKVIRSKGSVLYDGAIITSIAELPTDATLAKGDKEKEDAARKDLKAQLEAISKQLEELDADKTEAKAASDAKARSEAEAKKAEAAKAEAPKKAEHEEVKSSKPEAAAKPAEAAKSDKGK